MQENEFLTSVQRRAHLDSVEEARTATEATLATLGERLTAGEAEDVAAQLPDELAAHLREPGDEPAADLSAEAFLERVADRATVDEEPEELVRAVTGTVATAVSGGELDDARSQLPAAYDRLFADGVGGERAR